LIQTVTTRGGTRRMSQQAFCSDLKASATFESNRAKNRLSSSLETKKIVTGDHKRLARRPHGEDARQRLYRVETRPDKVDMGYTHVLYPVAAA